MRANPISIIDQLTPDILGIFWITSEELRLELLGFDEFNYLFDGLISQYLYGQKDSGINPDLNKPNVFFTQNFGHKIFLAHIKMNTQIKHVIDQHLALVTQNNSGNRKRILIFNTTSMDVGSELEIGHPQFEFKQLVI